MMKLLQERGKFKPMAKDGKFGRKVIVGQKAGKNA